jgi:hypothetical protein
MNDTISFIADKVKLNGPRVDGSYTVTFEVGEYMWDQIKELPKLNSETIIVGVITEKTEKTKAVKEEKGIVEDLPQIEG